MEGDGWLMGVSGREGGEWGAPGRGADPRIARGTGNCGQGGVSRSLYIRLPRLSRIPSADAAVCLPKMGGPAEAARTSGTQVGSSAALARLSDATRGCAARSHAARSLVRSL